eukprot:10227979-Lingulodinium_polyedra.AAC.1
MLQRGRPQGMSRGRSPDHSPVHHRAVRPRRDPGQVQKRRAFLSRAPPPGLAQLQAASVRPRTAELYQQRYGTFLEWA